MLDQLQLIIGLQYRAEAKQPMVTGDFELQVHGLQETIGDEHPCSAGLGQIHQWLTAGTVQAAAVLQDIARQTLGVGIQSGNYTVPAAVSGQLQGELWTFLCRQGFDQ